MQHSAESNVKIEYLRKYKFTFKTALAHKSEDPGVLFAEKNRGSKILWDCPFNLASRSRSIILVERDL
jgi:hypothetical protein